jgi:hypothetical protein
MCCDKSEDKALETAHKYFRWSLTGWPVQAELPDTKSFEAASQYISPEAVAEKISCGPMHKVAVRQPAARDARADRMASVGGVTS